MKINIIVILILMPLLALGQNDLNDEIINNKYIPSEISFENQPISNTYKYGAVATETTLIDDTRFYNKTALNFDLYKLNDLSLTSRDDNTLRLNDEQLPEEILIKAKSLIDYKSQFKKPIKLNTRF